MAQNPLQSELIGLFAQTQAVIAEFVASSSATERAMVGTEEEWSAKDLLANVACWMAYMAQRMAYFTRGEPAPREVDFDAQNKQAYVAYQHRPWADAVSYAEQSLAGLIAAVGSFSDAQLNAENAYDNAGSGPLAGEIRANGFIYPLQEFEKYYLRVGEQERAAAVRARLNAASGDEAAPIVTDLIAPQDLAAQRRGGKAPLVIDVRGPGEYRAGHVPGAINIPLADLPRQLPDSAADRPIVTYCNMHHKGASRGEQAAALLTAKGYQAAAIDGGYPAWQNAGLPVETA